MQLHIAFLFTHSDHQSKISTYGQAKSPIQKILKTEIQGFGLWLTFKPPPPTTNNSQTSNKFLQENFPLIKVLIQRRMKEERLGGFGNRLTY